MKRTLTITLTVAMLGSLLFMGMAGTVAAQEVSVDLGDQTSGDAITVSEVNQENNNAQIGISNAEARNGVAVASLDQDQSGVQVNNANVEQEAETGNEREINVELGLLGAR